MAMDPELLPSLVSYYQQVQCTKEIAYHLDLKRQQRTHTKLQGLYRAAQDEKKQSDKEIGELKEALAQAQATSEVRQREIESLRVRHENTDKADKTIAGTLKVQTDSFKREISELRDDLRLRNEELEELRQDAIERDHDLKSARDMTRARDKEMKEVRDQVRARESEVRKANHLIEKLQASMQTMEADLAESRDALEAMKEALNEAEDRIDTLQVQKQIVPAVAARAAPRAAPAVKPTKPAVKVTKAREPSPILPDLAQDDDESSDVPAPTPPSKKQIKHSTPIQKAADTDYTDPPSVPNKQVKAKPQTKPSEAPKTKAKTTARRAVKSQSNKENQNMNGKAGKKVKAVDDFSASPPRSSPPPSAQPKRTTKKKPDFSMTPFVEKTNGKPALSMIPLSPPTPAAKSLSRKADALEALRDDPVKPKKKRKLLGGVKSLMDDTPKKAPTKAAKVNFGKELSPLKRPSSGISGFVLK